MKKIFLSTISAVMLLTTGCRSLDMSPLSQGSSENWFSSPDEFVMALNDLYRPAIWFWEGNRLFHTDRWTDDWNQRDYGYEWVIGTLNSETSYVETTWLNTYKGITRTNTILSNVREMRENGGIGASMLDLYEGEACFFRACFYSYLIFLYGDAPFYTEYISLDDAYGLDRTDKRVILSQIYKDFDNAAALLPEGYSDLQRVTKGAAYAFKARTATWMLDYETAAEAAKDCMDLDVYSLHEDFGEMFLSKTRSSPEFILTLPRSKDLMDNAETVKSMIPRNVGGNATAQPSWELLCAFLDTKGNPIDKSDLYDPANPFKNRDPRLAQTMVEFGTEHLGYIYDPGAKSVLNTSTGLMADPNLDSQLGSEHAAWNGMCLKKHVDEEWLDQDTDPSIKLMRYADVLLMYAEAKIELNQIDQSVRDAINLVRARAYKVNVTETTGYPAVTETDQAKLRKILRMERRMELAWENRRWFDLIRWRLCETALTRPLYSLPKTTGLQTLIDKGCYFFPKDAQYQPAIDDNGLVDLEPIYSSGYYRVSLQRLFEKRQYLLPIPSEDVMTAGLEQNDGY